MSVKRTIVLLVFGIAIAGLRPAAADQIFIVSPSGLENTDGDVAGQDSNPPLRAQRLHPAADFSALDGPHYITGISLRADKLQPAEAVGESSQFMMWLSTTDTTDLSSTYADNIGSDNTLVFDGAISLTYPADGPVGGPQPWGTEIVFDTPFLYDPGQGNLLVDTDTPVESTGTEGFLFDMQSVSYGAFAGGDPTLASGDVAQYQLPTRFTVMPVPEPSTIVLALLGVIGFGLARRRR